MRTILVASTILCSALVIGCNNDSSSKSAPSAKPTTTSASTSHASHQHAHAPEGVKPGSYAVSYTHLTLPTKRIV